MGLVTELCKTSELISSNEEAAWNLLILHVNKHIPSSQLLAIYIQLEGHGKMALGMNRSFGYKKKLLHA